MMGLTSKQRECADFIRSHSEQTGSMPTYDEMCVGLGITSRSSIHRLLGGLEERGVLRRIKGRARALELVDPEKMRAVLLNDEIYSLLLAYASGQRIGLDTAANELLRQSLGASE